MNTFFEDDSDWETETETTQWDEWDAADTDADRHEHIYRRNEASNKMWAEQEMRMRTRTHPILHSV